MCRNVRLVKFTGQVWVKSIDKGSAWDLWIQGLTYWSSVIQKGWYGGIKSQHMLQGNLFSQAHKDTLSSAYSDSSMQFPGGFSDPPQQPEGSVAQKVAKEASPTLWKRAQLFGAQTLRTLQRKGPINSGPEETREESQAGALTEPSAQGDGTTKQPGKINLWFSESLSSSWVMVGTCQNPTMDSF